MAAVGVLFTIILKNIKSRSDPVGLILFLTPIMILISGLYGAELFIRTYLFILPAVIYFAIKLLKIKLISVVFCFALIFIVPLNIIATYGNAKVDVLSPGEIAYWHFMQEKAGTGDILGGVRIYYPDYTYDGEYYSKYIWTNNSFINTTKKIQPAQYVHIGKLDESRFEYYYDDTKTMSGIKSLIINSDTYHLIYDNYDAKIYLNENGNPKH